MSIHHAKNLNVNVGYTKKTYIGIIMSIRTRMKINEKYVYMPN